MRLDLKKDISSVCEKWVIKASEVARKAHRDHEYAGGYTFEHAVALTADNKASLASLNYHLSVEQARMVAICDIKSASHGNEMSAIVTRFEAELSNIKFAG